MNADRIEGRHRVQWKRLNSREEQGLARSASAPFLPARGGMVRFMLAIDNFDHVSLAYGSATAAIAVARVRDVIRDWLGERAELHFESGGIFYGTLHPQPSAQFGPSEQGAVRAKPVGLGQASAHRAVNRLLINPPLVTLRHGSELICLSLSGTWAVHDGQAPDPDQGFEGGCRVPFHGALPGRGATWTEQYRADMAIAASVLAAIDRYSTPTSERVPACSTAGPVFHGGGSSEGSAGPRRNGSVPVADQLVFAWRAIRDGRFGQDVLYYEMCPQLVGANGLRKDLAELRPALERLGLAVMLDCYLVDHAVDLLEADPDVAVSVQISAQSASACARWSDVFRRLTGSRGLAGRLTVAIAESANFPDFAEAIQFVSRLQAFGSAVAVDNFGLGYTSIRELLALSPDIVCIDPFFVRHGCGDAPEGAVLGHLAGLGALLANTVVVKGVANERHNRLALEAGIRWQQGDFLGAPTIGRPWASGAPGRPCHLQQRMARRSRAA